MVDPVSTSVIAGAVGGVVGKLVEKIWDSAVNVSFVNGITEGQGEHFYRWQILLLSPK